MATAMSVDELEKKEEEEFRTGPLSVLTTSVKTNSQARGDCLAPSVPAPADLISKASACISHSSLALVDAQCRAAAMSP